MATPTPTQGSVIYGDVNDDGYVDSLDLSVLKRYVLRKPVSVNVKAADVNIDGSIDSLDVSVLKRYLLRKYHTYHTNMFNRNIFCNGNAGHI